MTLHLRLCRGTYPRRSQSHSDQLVDAVQRIAAFTAIADHRLRSISTSPTASP